MRWLLSVALLLALTLTGCSPAESPPPSRQASSAPAGAGPAAVSPVHVDGPGAGSVQVSDAGRETSPSEAFTYASDVYQLSPSGPRPRTVVRLTLQTALPAGFGAVVATREATGQPWSYLPATLSADRSSVTFATTHFSFFTAIGLDLPAIAHTFKTDFLDGLSNGALQNDISKPTCDQEDTARTDGFKIGSTTTTDTVYWCFGIEHGSRVLKVTDHRRYPLLVSHPNMATLDNEIDKFALSSLSHLGSGRQTVVGPGNTVTYNADLEPGDSEGISTEMDGVGQTLYTLQVGIDSLFDILTDFGGSDIARLGATAAQAKKLQLLNGLVSSRSCLDALGESAGDVLSACFDADELLSSLGTDALLVAPIFAVGELLSFGRAEVNALVDTATSHDRYHIVITRRAETAPIVGVYCGEGEGFEPSSILWGCDGTQSFDSMRWSTWGDDDATGTGTVRLTDCTPACANGTSYTVPVAVRLSEPKRSPKCGKLWYSTITFAYTGKLPPASVAEVDGTYLGHPSHTLTDWGSPCP